MILVEFQSFFVVLFQIMAAFLPETDSEDELPGEWEERVTVDGSVGFFWSI